MNLELNCTQKNIANNIIKLGLSKAAESLSFFMKHTIKIEGNDFDIIDISATQPNNNSDEKYKVLQTELMGELKGASYLILTDSEANQLYNKCLPIDVLNNPTKLAMMGEAILLEVDNIITASVVTQFSNILKLKVYGGVPKMQESNTNEIINLITKNSTENSYLLNIKAKFTSDEMNFSPEFLWLLDKKFIDTIISLDNDFNINELKSI